MIGELGERIATLVRSNMLEIPDFPEPGVLFRDITELFANGPAFKELVELIGARYAGRIDAVAGLESRGFILGAPVAAELGLGLLTIRKAGKLPGHVIGVEAVAVLLELDALGGRSVLTDVTVESALHL